MPLAFQHKILFIYFFFIIKKSIMNFSESRQNRSRENREKSKNRFFPPTPTGKYQTEAVTYRPSDSDVDTANAKSDISQHDRTVEVSKLFIFMAFLAPFILLMKRNGNC